MCSKVVITLGPGYRHRGQGDKVPVHTEEVSSLYLTSAMMSPGVVSKLLLLIHGVIILTKYILLTVRGALSLFTHGGESGVMLAGD